MRIKFDTSKILSLSVTILGVAGTLLSSKVESDNRKAMKDELLNELKKDLRKK
jgi:hypothetical protein